MSSASTVREGLRDNPLRIAVAVRTALVVLIGALLTLSLAADLISQAASPLPIRLPSEYLRSALFLASLIAGLVAEFTSFRIARVVNPSLYTAYVVWFAFVPWELAAEILLFTLAALYAAVLWALYGFTSPRRLALGDAA